MYSSIDIYLPSFLTSPSTMVLSLGPAVTFKLPNPVDTFHIFSWVSLLWLTLSHSYPRRPPPNWCFLQPLMCWYLPNPFLSLMSVRQMFTHRHLKLTMSQIKFICFPPQFCNIQFRKFRFLVMQEFNLKLHLHWSPSSILGAWTTVTPFLFLNTFFFISG